MKNVTLKKWQLGVLTFVPFLGIINPVLFVILAAIYFVGWVGYLMWG